MNDNELRHKNLRICHKKGRIEEVYNDSCNVSINIGGVHQHVVVTREFAEENIETTTERVGLP